MKPRQAAALALVIVMTSYETGATLVHAPSRLRLRRLGWAYPFWYPISELVSAAF